MFIKNLPLETSSKFKDSENELALIHYCPNYKIRLVVIDCWPWPLWNLWIFYKKTFWTLFDMMECADLPILSIFFKKIALKPKICYTSNLSLVLLVSWICPVEMWWPDDRHGIICEVAIVLESWLFILF